METPWNNWFSDSDMTEPGFLQQWEIGSSNSNGQENMNMIPQSLHGVVGGSSDYGSGVRVQETISWNFNLGSSNQRELDHGSCSPSGMVSLDLPPNPNPSKGAAFAKMSKEEQKLEVRGAATTTTTTALSQAQEHIIAERSRREKLNQKFIALSALIPGLKKADKASVLGDAVRHVKFLQERVKVLEEQNMERTVESVVLIKKSLISVTDDSGSSSDENNLDQSSQPSQLQPFPEIEVKVSGKTVLVRIHCENHKGVLVKVLSEIESMNLIIANTNVMPFLGSSLNITVTAQMEMEFSMTVKDIVRKLKSSLV